MSFLFYVITSYLYRIDILFSLNLITYGIKQTNISIILSILNAIIALVIGKMLVYFGVMENLYVYAYSRYIFFI